ncbi:hypothetical protein BJY01DRAFT_206134 [Aspergillus pseudoustus]|uniref:Altered inheritance of mitochondria protein 21 n=1 Tax=Aspergillus pseudoustus TaxID=1810923 RepID=A0ABR4KNS3_9EURO
MPPTFRSSRSGRQLGDGVNRTRTGQIDHDVFEGLPVRRWTRQLQTVSQEPKTDGTESEAPGHGVKQTIPEHPMPRDSHLLAPMSRALLRAARSGCIYIRQASKEDEDEEKEATDPEEQQVLQNMERNFSMRKWATVPKHLEPLEVEFLAKRRPGLPSLYGATAGTVEGANGSVPMRKTRFKKVDPITGNISIYAAWVPEGHKIEGEVTDDAQLAADNSKITVTPEAPAPGTVIEGVGVVNAEGVVVAEAGSAAVLTPQRRRPPPPKRKGKGLKGRRKKVMFAPGEGADASLVHGAGTGASDNATSYGKDTDSSHLSVDQTTQDDEDDDGEDGEESDDGEGDESGFDAKTPETPGPQPSTEPEAKPTPVPGSEQIATSAITTLAPEAPLVQTPTQPAAPPLEGPSHPTANPASSIPTDEPSAVAIMPAKSAEDIQMTDAAPVDDALHPPAPISNAQPPTAPEIAQPIPYEKHLSPPHAQQAPAPGPTSGSSEPAGEHMVPQPTEPQDSIMAESSGPVSEPTQTETASSETGTTAPQPLQTEVPEPTPVPQQLDQQQSSGEFDLLDNLEASLNNLPKETPGDKQQEPPDQRPRDLIQEGAAEPEPVAPSQPPTETPTELNLAATTTGPSTKETPTPTVPATIPEIGPTPGQGQQQSTPPPHTSLPTLPEQQQSHQSLDQASEAPLFSEPLPSTQIPLGISQGVIPEQPVRSPLQSAPPQPPPEARAAPPPTTAAEPPVTEESLLPPSLPQPATEQPPSVETSFKEAPNITTEQLEHKAPAEAEATVSIQSVSEAQVSQPPSSLVRSPPVTSGTVESPAEPEQREQQSEAGSVQQGEEQEANGVDSLVKAEEARP